MGYITTPSLSFFVHKMGITSLIESGQSEEGS